MPIRIASLRFFRVKSHWRTAWFARGDDDEGGGRTGGIDFGLAHVWRAGGVELDALLVHEDFSGAGADGVTDNGERILAFLSTTLDQMDEIRLHMPDVPQSVERLMPDGTWMPVAFHVEDNGDIVFETEAKTFQVAVLRGANW